MQPDPRTRSLCEHWTNSMALQKTEESKHYPFSRRGVQRPRKQRAVKALRWHLWWGFGDDATTTARLNFCYPRSGLEPARAGTENAVTDHCPGHTYVWGNTCLNCDITRIRWQRSPLLSHRLPVNRAGNPSVERQVQAGLSAPRTPPGHSAAGALPTHTTATVRVGATSWPWRKISCANYG